MYMPEAKLSSKYFGQQNDSDSQNINNVDVISYFSMQIIISLLQLSNASL